jgi:sulfide:quinone oxidoreductase
MPSKTVVILGGGVGGMIAANQLRKRLAPDHRVVLVERNADHAFAPSFL